MQPAKRKRDHAFLNEDQRLQILQLGVTHRDLDKLLTMMTKDSSSSQPDDEVRFNVSRGGAFRKWLNDAVDIKTPYGNLVESTEIMVNGRKEFLEFVNPFALVSHSCQQQPKFSQLLYDYCRDSATLMLYTDGLNGGDPLGVNAAHKTVNTVSHWRLSLVEVLIHLFYVF